MKLIHESSNDKQGKRSQALRRLQCALELSPPVAQRVVIHSNIGALLLEQHETLDAITHYRKAIELNPKFWKAHYNLGLGLVESDRLLEAKRHFEVAFKLNPTIKSNAQLRIKRIDDQLRDEASRSLTGTAEVQNFAREMTETLHLLSNVRDKTRRPVDNASTLESLAFPICQPRPSGWMDGINSVLHRFYVKSAMLRLDPIQLLEASDPTMSGYISMKEFTTILGRVDIPLSQSEQQQLFELFPSGSVWYRILAPNKSTIRAIDRIQEQRGTEIDDIILSAPSCKSRIRALQEMPIRRWLEYIFNGQKGSEVLDKYGEAMERSGYINSGEVGIRGIDLCQMNELGIEDKMSQRILHSAVHSLTDELQIHAAVIVQSMARMIIARKLVRERRYQLAIGNSQKRESVAKCDVASRRNSIRLARVREVLDDLISQVERNEPDKDEFIADSMAIPIRTELRPMVNSMIRSTQLRFRTGNSK